MAVTPAGVWVADAAEVFAVDIEVDRLVAARCPRPVVPRLGLLLVAAASWCDYGPFTINTRWGSEVQRRADRLGRPNNAPSPASASSRRHSAAPPPPPLNSSFALPQQPRPAVTTHSHVPPRRPVLAVSLPSSDRRTRSADLAAAAGRRP